MANRVEKEYATALFELNPQDEVVEKNLAQLIDIHKEIVFGDLKDERFREMIRESLRIMMDKI